MMQYQSNPLRQMIKGAMVRTVPARLFLTRLGARDRVSLTFDDGPHPEFTPQLLDTLAELDVRATFFVVGRAAAAYRDLVRRIAAEGHEVGHHSYTHSPPAQTSSIRRLDEARRTIELLSEVTGKVPHLYRPPLGKVRAAELIGLWAMRQSVVLWNSDPRDYGCGGPDEIASFFADNPLRGGEIVLLHEQHQHTARALPDLVRSVRELGLELATVGDWLDS